MNNKVKLCILSNGLARGGTDTFVVNLVKHLDKGKFDITVVNSFNTDLTKVREPEILAEGVPVVHTADNLDSFANKIKHLLKLYKILKLGKYDVFQTNIDLFNGPQLLVAWLAGVKVRVCHSHNTQQELEVQGGRTLSVSIYQAAMRWLCWNFSTRRCGCSEDAMDFLFKGQNWRQNKYPSIIYNGINIDRFRVSVNKQEKKKELGLTKPKNILTVGQMINQKNPEFIVKCMASYLSKHEDTDFVWVGTGRLKEHVEQWITDTGIKNRFHLLGSINNVNEVMLCCDAFFLPSNFEGLGIVLIEAQAAGMSCVASTAVPALANCGKLEYVPLSESYQQWHNALDRAVENSSAVNEEALQKFSIENMAEQMTRVFLA